MLGDFLPLAVVLSSFIVCSSLEIEFTDAVSPHDAALVHIAIDTVDAAFASVLPNDVVTLVGQMWFIIRVRPFL